MTKMTKEEAQKRVQELLSEAMALVREAEGLMNEHRFTTDFMGRDYCPDDLTSDEIDEGYFPINRDWMSVGDGGEWMGSSDRC